MRLWDYLEQVTRHSPDKAAELFGRLEAPERLHAAGNVLKVLAAKDWRRAAEWGKGNLTPEEWKEAAKKVFNDYTGHRIAELKGIGDQITDDPVLRSVAYSRSVFWPAAKSGETLDRALALPAGSLDSEGWREVGITCGMRELHSPDPAAAADTLRNLTQRVPEEHREDFLATAVRTACYNDGPLAAQFFEVLPPDQVTTLSESWTRKDPAAASAWLSTLPPSERRDTAVLAFCREAAPVDPAGAAVWAMTLADAARREPAVRNAFSVWRQNDPAAADGWAAENGLAELLKKSPDPGK